MSAILLRFTREGLHDHYPSTVEEFNATNDDILIHNDGSTQGYEAIVDWVTNIGSVLDNPERIVLMRTPLYDLRMINADGTLSHPHFIFDEDHRVKWTCSQIAVPQLEIYLSDITDSGGTRAKQNTDKAELICYLAHRLWTVLLIAEERLCFPAAALDRLTRWTFRLTKQTIDIDLLRRETGIPSLDYNDITDLLSITLGGEIFTVKLSVLNALYGELILPKFNRVYGRRLRISVGVVGRDQITTEPVDMSYGELGRLIEDMRRHVKEQRTSPTHPIDPTDLMLLSRKQRRSQDNSLQVRADDYLPDLITQHRTWFVPGELSSDPDDADFIEILPEPVG